MTTPPPPPRVLLDGLAYVESARWHDGRCWFAHWGTGEIVAVDLDGNHEVMAHGPLRLGWSIDWLPDGRRIATTPGGVVVGPDLAPYGATGQPFNEIVVDAAGRAWVDMPGAAPWEASKPGIVAVVLPDGTSRQVADDVWFPNGMVILGEETLVLAESHADRLTAWTITDSGELVDRRVWADLGPGSAPDGICADAEGAIWYASVPGQRCTRVAEGGAVLDTIHADRGCFACMLGGEDGGTLYIVANNYAGYGASDGVVLTQPVSIPRAGRP